MHVKQFSLCCTKESELHKLKIRFCIATEFFLGKESLKSLLSNKTCQDLAGPLHPGSSPFDELPVNTHTGPGQLLGGSILPPLVTNSSTSWLVLQGYGM